MVNAPTAKTSLNADVRRTAANSAGLCKHPHCREINMSDYEEDWSELVKESQRLRAALMEIAKECQLCKHKLEFEPTHGARIALDALKTR